MPELDAAVCMIVAWLTVVGAAVGSFLNVVVYRLPLGIGLVRPPSACPKCGRRIAWYDNVPVLGWMMLRGRCRQCREPISARYPMVEAITAAMFGVVAVVEMPYLNALQFYWLYPYHLLLLCTLLCAGLIEYDGNRAPLRLFVPALVVGAAAPLWWPALRALPMWFGLWGQWPVWLCGAIDGLAGLAAGAILAGVAYRLLPGRKLPGLMLSLVCVGLSLGWEAVTFIAMPTAIFECAQGRQEPASPGARIPATVSLGIFTLVWVLCWAWLVLR